MYSTNGNILIDILECDGVRIEPNSGEIVVDFLSPRIENVIVGYDGKREIRENELRWDQILLLRLTEINESRKIDITEDQVKKYQSSIKRKVEQFKK